MSVVAFRRGTTVVDGDRPRTIGEYVRRRRDELGMTQKELAEAIDREQNYVSVMERNQTDGYLPPRDVMASLARALRVTDEDLLRAAGYLQAPAEDGREIPDDVRVYTMMIGEVDKLQNAPPSLRDHIRQTIKYALEEERRLRGESQKHHNGQS